MLTKHRARDVADVNVVCACVQWRRARASWRSWSQWHRLGEPASVEWKNLSSRNDAWPACQPDLRSQKIGIGITVTAGQGGDVHNLQSNSCLVDMKHGQVIPATLGNRCASSLRRLGLEQLAERSWCPRCSRRRGHPGSDRNR